MTLIYYVAHRPPPNIMEKILSVGGIGDDDDCDGWHVFIAAQDMEKRKKKRYFRYVGPKAHKNSTSQYKDVLRRAWNWSKKQKRTYRRIMVCTVVSMQLHHPDRSFRAFHHGEGSPQIVQFGPFGKINKYSFTLLLWLNSFLWVTTKHLAYEHVKPLRKAQT